MASRKDNLGVRGNISYSSLLVPISCPSVSSSADNRVLFSASPVCVRGGVGWGGRNIEKERKLI